MTESPRLGERLSGSNQDPIIESGLKSGPPAPKAAVGSASDTSNLLYSRTDTAVTMIR